MNIEIEPACPKKGDGTACVLVGPQPVFDAEAASGLDAPEVRRRWPRTKRACVACGAATICYASWAHYAAGDW